MGDQQGAIMAPDVALDAELARIIRIAENVNTYRHRELRTYAYKIIRENFPERITRERWQEIAGIAPDDSLTTERRTGLIADRVLLRQHGRALCCDQCDQENARQLREQLGPVAAPEAPEHEDDDPEEPEPCTHDDVTECERCGGSLDRVCEHEYVCPECDHEGDTCRDCGADRQCYHIVTCRDCDVRLREADEFIDLEPV